MFLKGEAPLGVESEVLIPELFSGAKVLYVSDIGEERIMFIWISESSGRLKIKGKKNLNGSERTYPLLGLGVQRSSFH